MHSPTVDRWARGGAAAALLAGLLGVAAEGCREAPPPPPLRVATYSDPQVLDPHLKDEFLTRSILSNIYDGLTVLDPDLRVAPALAASWESVDDLTWRFHLRPGVTFHDGRPLSSADVVFSLDRAKRHPRSERASALVAVREVQALDAVTVQITTERPYAVLLNQLAAAAIVPQGSPEEIREPVGTGPYRFVSYEPGKRIEFARVEGHWRGGKGPARVELLIDTDPAVRVQKLLAGEVDLVQELAPAAIESLRENPAVEVVTREGLAVTYLQGRMDQPPFSDLRVRQAVNLAIDREALVEDMAAGYGRPLAQLVGRVVFGYAPDLEVPRRDLDAARRLLAEAGYPNGLDVDLEYRAGRRVEAIERQLAEAGIRLHLVPRPWTELYPRLTSRQVGFYFGAVTTVSGDAITLLDTKLHTRDEDKSFGDNNANYYSNPELDALLERTDSVFDMKQRGDLLQQAMKLAMRDLPVIPLFTSDDLYAMRKGLRWTPRSDGIILFDELDMTETK